MESLIIKRLENLVQMKIFYKERLKKINPKQDNSIVDNVLNVKFESKKFGASNKVSITNQPNGIEIVSNLDSNEHQYLYLTEKSELENVLKFLKDHVNIPMNLTINGFFDNDLDIEIFLILLKENGERVNIKTKLGDHKVFTIDEKDQIKNIKITIRVKGNGFAYIHNAHLYSKSLEKIENFEKNCKRIKKIKDLNVLFIGDEFTTRCFEPEFNLIKVTPENWGTEVLNIQPDLFFCESAWLGNNGTWEHKVGTGGPRNNSILLNLVSWCKTNEIPTVFWNKEDPFHFNAFIETAKHFDYVFTTDSNSIEKYKSLGCRNVFAMPFAAQPKFHNPIEIYERINKIVFAGAYYGDKFIERKQVMDNMIEISGKYGIDIYDRNYNNPESPNQFPEKFKEYINGTLKDNEIEKAYKGYKVSLNVNSIVDSPTMFARRVFELLASNTPVISSKSLGINKMFGELVVATNDINELRRGINKYFNDRDFYLTNRLLTLRKVMSEHTYTNRIEKMFNEIGFDFVSEKRDVTVIGIVKSIDDYRILLNQFNRQEWNNKKLIIFIDLFDGYLDLFNENNNDQIKTYIIDYLHNYNSLNEIIDTQYVAFFNKSNYYGKNYLTDMMLATLYVPNAMIVKNIGEEYNFVNFGKKSESLLKKDLMLFLKPIQLIEIGESLKSWFKFGIQFFNIDNFNLIPNINKVRNIQATKKRINI